MRVLIADHDRGRGKALAEACLARGHVVERAAQGAAALELALERIPDALVCPIDLAVIDAERLSEILRGNPRTRTASFIFLVNDDLDAPISMDSRDATVVSPWAEEDVLDDLDAIAERERRFGEGRPDTEIEGKLSQISLADLLQIFQMNHKSGTIRLSSAGLDISAMLSVADGQVVDAVVPLRDGTAVVGEKALYRLLKWAEGRFEFVPGTIEAQPRITKPTRVALLEGMRHRDEWEQLVREMPPLESRVRLVPGADTGADVHPLTREVVDGVEAYRRIGEIVDHCSFPDYQVLRAISDLMSREVIELEKADEDDVPTAAGDGLLGHTQARRLREWMATQRPRPSATLKVLVAASDAGCLGRFVDLLRRGTDFVVDGRLVRQPERLSQLVTLGHLGLADGLGVRLIALPPQELYAPLWDVACHGILGSVIVPGPSAADLARTEAVARRLLERSGRPVLHALVSRPAGEEAAGLRESIEALGGAGAVGLPSSAPGPSMQDLFTRLLP